ncbi:spermidine/putrescine ABC transporter substrate-binding protein, partial [Streptomyces sp. NPDC058992]
MKQYQPERLSEAQLAAMRRSLTNGRGALSRRSLRGGPRGGGRPQRGHGGADPPGRPPPPPRRAGGG